MNGVCSGGGFFIAYEMSIEGLVGYSQIKRKMMVDENSLL